MDLDYSGDNVGNRGSDLNGIMVGSMLSRDDGKNSTMMIVLAVVFFVIIFIIALVFLAMAFKDKGHDRGYAGGTDIAAILTPLIAAKSMDGGCKNGEIDKLEIMQKLEHNEDRAETRRIQEEQNRQTQSFMQLGFGLSGQMHANEKTELENFSKLENQMGMMQMGMTQLLQKSNNEDIIQGVINRLCGVPCFARP